VVNRILMPYLNEAVLLVAEGLKIEQVDEVMKRFGMQSMGPLELLDEIGLDVAAHVAEAMRPEMAERFDPNPGFELMRANDWLGKKTKKGFYVHHKDKQRENLLAANALKSSRSAQLPLSSLPLVARLTEARERMVLLTVNEAAMVLGEGLVEAPAQVDLAMVLGTGWAPHRGGPLSYGEQRGWSEVVTALTNLASRHGKRFEPCAELKQRALEGDKMAK
jgi:3-hydroxyacyl-CoA dehydrogenase/enoyl-CoA hydratase/3-hydroxybutyryl-CoA epimerase